MQKNINSIKARGVRITTSYNSYKIMMNERDYQISKHYDISYFYEELCYMLAEIEGGCINEYNSTNYIDEFFKHLAKSFIINGCFYIKGFTVRDYYIECYIGCKATEKHIRFVPVPEYILYEPKNLGVDTITSDECFRNEDSFELMMAFIHLQNTRGYTIKDIRENIGSHSLFGKAYYNAVLRISKYTYLNGVRIINCHTPSYNDVSEELYKILLKYISYKYQLDDTISEYFNKIGLRLKQEDK